MKNTNTSKIRALGGQRRGGRSRLYLLACCILGLFQMCGQAQVTLNVRDFGAAGDAVQFYVNTVSNSAVVTTTNRFSTADIGKFIEIFRVGKPTSGVNSYGVATNDNQDLIAQVTNVVSGTNLYLNVVQLSGSTTNFLPQVKRTAWATMGTDNTPIFNDVIQNKAAPYTNATIYIPNGTYLCLSRLQPSVKGYASFAIPLYRGGLHIVGESQSGTVLLSRGAWQSWANGAYPVRGFLFEVVAPIMNDSPLIIDNLTLDGGVQQGNLSVHGIQCNKVDGLGWDEQHSAYLTFDSGNNSGTATHQVLTNLTVIHWRGEMIKSIDGNTNGNIAIKNCLFGDGCATALNIYPCWDVEYNTFSNLFQIAELYQKYYRATGYFCNNFATNITANGFAFNGGWAGAMPFIMQSNVFYFNGVGYNGILTTPGVNISILNNKIHCADYMTVFNIGAPGAQGDIMNSNILISGNSISAPSKLTTVFNFGGGGGIGGVNGLVICSNDVSAPEQIFSIFQIGGNQTNIGIHDNQISSPMTSMTLGSVGSGNMPFALLPANNTYTAYPKYIASPQTNYISYTSGPLQRMDYVATWSAFILKDSESNQIPAGACLDFDNRSNKWAYYHGGAGGGVGDGTGGDIVVYPSEKMDSSVTIPFGQETRFDWKGGAWVMTNPVTNNATKPVAPMSLRVLN
jgi:hypothetical protein